MLLEQCKLFLQQRGNNRIIEELRNGKVYAYEKVQDCLTQVQANGRINEGRAFYSDVNLRWGVDYLDISDVDLHNIELNKFLRIPFSNITKWPAIAIRF